MKINELIADKAASFIDPLCLLYYDDKERISIGDNVHISAYSVIHVTDCPFSNYKSRLKVGCNTYIGEFNNIRASGGIIEIGNNCLISQQITIVAANHEIRKDELIRTQPWKEGLRISIEDDVWIGSGAIILPGVVIGRGSVIAAGSVVVASVEPYSIVGGVPARVIGERK